MPVNLNNLKLKAAQTTLKAPVTTGSGAYSVGIVNSRNNGKRVSLSKALCEKLGLTEKAAFMPIADEKVLLIGKTLSFCTPLVGKLSGEGKKLCYNSGIVASLTAEFGLDFSSCTSMSFSKVEFETDENGEIIAVVTIA